MSCHHYTLQLGVDVFAASGWAGSKAAKLRCLYNLKKQMEAVQVVCPHGLFPLPDQCNIHLQALHVEGHVESSSHGTEHQLLGQLQGLNNRASRLVKLTSVSREQGAASYVAELQALSAEALLVVQHTLVQAASAKQPLLLNSSQHSSCFCKLLEQLHLLDVLHSSVAAAHTGQPQEPAELLQGAAQQLLLQEQHAGCLRNLEQQLQHVPGIDSVLAALAVHCQQNLAAGSRLSIEFAASSTSGKAEAIDVGCLSSIHVQQSAARALPILLRLYFTNNSRLETVAAGKPEPLTPKMLERCLNLIAAKPVVPGYADTPICLISILEDCKQLQEVLAARKLKLPPTPSQLDYKSAAKLEQSYSIQAKVLPLLKQHDELCDLLSQLALEVKQAVVVDRDVDPKAFVNAEQLVVDSINFVAAAKNSLLELDAWRLSNNATAKQWQQKQYGAADAQELCDRLALKDEDVVPFMDVLGATKGLTGLLTDSSSWLQQLLQVHTVKQLQDFANNALPALAKLYPRNKRVQSLLRRIMSTMQGQQVELHDEMHLPSYATSMAGDAAEMTPQPGTPPPYILAAEDWQLQPFRRQSGPVAEGREGPGLFRKLSSRMSPLKSRPQQQHQQQQEEEQQQPADEQTPGSEDPLAVEQEMAEAALEAAAVAAAATEVAAAEYSSVLHSETRAEPSTAAESGGSCTAENGDNYAAAIEENRAQQLAMLEVYAAAAQAQPPASQQGKKSLLKKLRKSVRGGSKKGRPEPSPAPELCSAPAALAGHAQAEYEALLSEVAAEAEGGELHEAIAAAAADSEAKGWPAGAEAAALGLQAQLATQRDEEGSLQLRGDGSNALPGLSSMNSLNTATFERPPELPWETSDGLAAGVGGAESQQQSPRSVALAAAAFENKIAAGRRSSRLSTACHSNTSPVAPHLAATSSASTAMGLDLPQLNLPEVLNGDDPVETAVALELAQSAGTAVDAEGNPIPCSPRSARKFHLFKFKSILQHHEKISTGVLPASLPAPVVDEAADEAPAAAPAGEMGAGARFMAALSMRRRHSAAGAVSAAAAALVDDELLAAAADAARASSTANDSDVAGASKGTPRQSDAAADLSGHLLQVTQGGDACDAADVPACASSTADAADQPSKQGKVAGVMSRVSRALSRGLPIPAAAAAASSQQMRQGFKGLNLTAKLKKAMVDRRQTTAAEGVIDGLPLLQLESPPPLACLMQLRVLLEQLMHEIKAETKKHLVTQLQLAAAAAAGSTSTKPDASIARPLRQVKAMIKAVHRMQLVLDYPRQLAAAADLSSLWVSKAYSNFFGTQLQQLPNVAPAAAEGVTHAGREQLQAPGSKAPSRADTKVLYNLLYEDTSEDSLQGTAASTPAKQQGQLANSKAATPQPSARHVLSSSNAAVLSFPGALLAVCMRQLHKLPAELPLLVLQLFWDARGLLQSCNLLDQGLPLLQQQEEACMHCYMQHIVPAAYAHYTKVAAHQTVTYELLSSCGAHSLQPIQTLYLEALLREPCPVVVQGSYAAEGPTAAGKPVHHGSAPASSEGPANTAATKADAPQSITQQLAAQQHVQQLEVCLQQDAQRLSQAEAEQLAAEHVQTDQQQHAPGSMHGSSSKAKQCSAASSPDRGESKQHKRRRGRAKHRSAGREKDEAAPAVVAGPTPLMQKLELLRQDKHLLDQQYNAATQALVAAQESSVVDVRQWLLDGLVSCLKRDASAVVACARSSAPSAVVQLQTQKMILQRTHQLLSQYAPLSCTWVDLWNQADAADECESATTDAIAAGVLSMLSTAVYDSEAQVLLPKAGTVLNTAGFVAPNSSWAGVFAEVSAALKPLGSFLGRQHLQALLDFSGPVGQQYLLAGLLARLEEQQEVLLMHLQPLQHKLPAGLLQLPPAEQYHDAPAVLQFYQQQLSGTLSDGEGCSAALASLQRIGNCLALLHLMSIQQSVQATPVFMQVAPFLGIVGCPLTDAAAAAECFEFEGGPEPPAVCETTSGVISRSCTAGLLMPEIERMQPSEAALKAYQMQVQKELEYEQEQRDKAAAAGVPFDESLVKSGGDLAHHRMWQASHFQRLLLGPDAEMVRGPALLLAQNAELRAWQATEAKEYMGPCMQHVQRWAVKLQRQLQGLHPESSDDEAEVCLAEAHSIPAGCQQQQQCAMAVACASLMATEHVRASIAGEVPSGDVQAIGARENSLFGTSLPSTPLKAPPGQERQPAQQVQQQEHLPQSFPAESCVASAQQVQQQQEQGADGSLSLVCSSITVKPSSGSAQAEAGNRPFVSYDEEEDALPTPPSLQLDDALSAASSQPTASCVAATASLALKAGTVNTMVTLEELSVAAEVAAVAAASVPSSPRAVAAVAAASVPSSPKAGAGASSNAVSIWEAAGAAAAQISAGSVPPSLAKLAFRSLPSSAVVQPDAGVGVEPLLSCGQSGGGRTYGLAELVGEVSDAILSARSDAGAAYALHSDRSSRQVQLEMLTEQQQGDATIAPVKGIEEQTSARAAAVAMTGSMSALWELEKMKTQGSGHSSPCSSPRSRAQSFAGDHHGCTGESDTEQPDCRHISSQRSGSLMSPCVNPSRSPGKSHLHVASGPASSQQGADSAVDLHSTNNSRVGNATAAADATSSSPCRVAVPRLMLSPGSTTALDGSIAAAAGGSGTAVRLEGSRPLSTRGQISSRSGNGMGVLSEDAEDIDAEGSYPAPDVNDELFDSTCVELVRVKDENNMLRSEVEFLRNQLQNRDTSLALLSGNLYTPRPSEPGAVAAEDTLQSVASQTAVAPVNMRGSAGSASQKQSQEPGVPASSADAAKQDAAEHVVLRESATVTEPAAAAAAASAATAAATAGGVAEVAADKPPQQMPDHSPSTRQAQPKCDIAITAGLVKAVVGPGLSPEPSDIRPELSKMSIRAQQPSPAPDSSDDGSSSCEDDSEDDASSSAGDSTIAGCGSAATRKLKLPTALPAQGSGTDQAAQLAVALSALKFALLMDVATAQAGNATNSAAAAVGQQSAAATPQTSPLKRLKKAALSTVTAAEANSSTARAVAAEQPIKPGGVTPAIAAGLSGSAAAADAGGTIAEAQPVQAHALPGSLAQSAAAALARGTTPQQQPLGSGRIAGGRFGDGPLLAAAVLLQLAGQSRKHALLDATKRIAYWVEYDAVKSSGAGAEASGADSSSTAVPSGVQGPGGIAPSAADGVMQPKPRSRKRQEEEAEEEARLKQEQAAQQLLLQRLAAAARQAERVAKDGSSIAARFAPPAPAHSQNVRMQVYRVDELSLAAQHAAGVATAGAAAAAAGRSLSKNSSLGGSVSQGGANGAVTLTHKEHAVLAVPVKPEVVKFAPYVRPWMGMQPSNQPTQSHPALPMPRPRPLLLPNNSSDQAGAGVVGREGVQQAAAAAGGIIGPAGRLLPGVGVNANAGLVAAARAVHAKEALLAAMPRTAVYSFSVMSDHNRSGMHDDGYSKAPSVPEVDFIEDISPRKGGRHNTAAAATRLGGRHMSDLGALQLQGDQAMYGAAGGFSGSEASSPNKSPTRSPSKRQSSIAQAGGILASLVS